MHVMTPFSIFFEFTLATQRAQLEHLTKWLCPRPFNARPAFLRFWVIFGELVLEDQSEKVEKVARIGLNAKNLRMALYEF